MKDEYMDLPGDRIEPQKVVLPRSRELVGFLAAGHMPFARLVECLLLDGSPRQEIVIFDVEVERPQIRAHDIKRIERIAVCCNEADQFGPEVYALRESFPRVPHTNLGLTEKPRSLCLYDQTWDEVKLRWTAARFIDRVRWWLAETCKGTLHQKDQPLEPLLFTPLRLILPHQVLQADVKETILDVTAAGDESSGVYVASLQSNKEPGSFLALVLKSGAKQHGVIRHVPRDLQTLDEFTRPDLDLVASIMNRLEEWKAGKRLDAKLILVIVFPKTRDGSEIEAEDVYAFITDKTIKEIGVELGHWAAQGKGVYPLALKEAPHPEAISVLTLAPLFSLSRAKAAQFNGLDKPNQREMVAIGGGAIGSHVLLNLARAAYGRWTLVDEDFVLPHNIARHALLGRCVGYSKPIVLQVNLNGLYEDMDEERFIKEAIKANVLRPDKQAEKLTNAINKAEVILDMSASVAVARHLARDITAGPRRISMFFNPSATDLVILAEDADRKLPLDALEMQYYRAVASRPDLTDHFRVDGRLRYGQGCRDMSLTIPQDQVALLSATASVAYRRISESSDPVVRVWHWDRENQSLAPFDVPPAEVSTFQLGEWTVITDRLLAHKLFEVRRNKLPKETGGVLIGSFDLLRRIVYVVDTIPAPPDSKEWPTLFIRGHESLQEGIRQLSERTGHHLEYVGEWHSHPDGCPPLPSGDDCEVFSWLIRHMDVDGLPAMMFIVSSETYMCYLGTMKQPEPVEKTSRNRRRKRETQL